MHPPDRLRIVPALRRRGWLVVVTMLLVAALATGFASLKGKTYTTNLVMVVSLLNQGQPLADEADKLATTYAEVITDDGAILRRVGAAIGLSSTEVKENLEVTAAENTSIIHAVYTGNSNSEAVAATNALLKALTGPPPRRQHHPPHCPRRSGSEGSDGRRRWIQERAGDRACPWIFPRRRAAAGVGARGPKARRCESACQGDRASQHRPRHSGSR